MSIENLWKSQKQVTKKWDCSVKKWERAKLMNKAYNYMVWLRRQEKKLMNQISNFEELERGRSLNINKYRG